MPQSPQRTHRSKASVPVGTADDGRRHSTPQPDDDDDDQKYHTAVWTRLRHRGRLSLLALRPGTILAMAVLGFLLLIVDFDDEWDHQQAYVTTARVARFTSEDVIPVAPVVLVPPPTALPNAVAGVTENYDTAKSTTTTTTLTMQNVLWAGNYPRHATCPDVPSPYYRTPAAAPAYPTEQIQQWFATCQGIIWLRPPDLPAFVATVLPRLLYPFTLVTPLAQGPVVVPQHGTLPLPSMHTPQQYPVLLQHPLLQTWYTQTFDPTFPTRPAKVQPLPLGLSLDRDSTSVVEPNQTLQALLTLRANAMENADTRQHGLWIPPQLSADLAQAQQQQQQHSPCLLSSSSSSTATTDDPRLAYTRYRFGLVDTHHPMIGDAYAVWEMLLLGMIPVLRRTTTMMEHFLGDDSLPVWVVEDWSDLCTTTDNDKLVDLEAVYDRFRVQFPVPLERFTTAYYLGALPNEPDENKRLDQEERQTKKKKRHDC